ncbi:uncharacterized protein LOC118433332 [Folsomia candida]|uniref:uncharacterized protein LOC118433332 n=1 Tax=Folsomia candida TaxID=158441 RepID=UPI001604DF6F|nr:uncharacterized protein LOC118433332 [Folsomia candida]
MRQSFGHEVKSPMAKTVFQRRTIIRTSRVTNFEFVPYIVEIMPRLFDMEGMISQDFNSRHPSLALIMFDRWPKVTEMILEYAEDSGIDYRKKLDITKHRYDLSKDDIQFVGFCLLPFVLPSCGRKLTQTVEDINDTDEEGTANARSSTNMAKRKRSKGNAVTIKRRKTQMTTLKSSDLDALRSMLLIKPKNTNIAEVLKDNNYPPPSFWHWDQSQIWSFSISS